MTARFTDEPCARCTNKLATSNKSKDRLCGPCQRDLGPRASAAFRAWISGGRKREITRARASMFARATVSDLLAELTQRREELTRARDAADEEIKAITRALTPPARGKGEPHGA